MMRSLFSTKPATKQDPEPVNGAGVTILIVDDSPTETRLLQSALVKAGYRVESAVNGEQGVQVARQLHPDLILMDVVMPVLNGFQATRMLGKDPATADIPVIMITTKDQQTDKTWGLRQGAVEYLVKPVRPALLIGTIQTVLRG